MSEEIRQELNEDPQDYKKMIHAMVDDMNDVNVLKVIASFLFKHSFDGND